MSDLFDRVNMLEAKVEAQKIQTNNLFEMVKALRSIIAMQTKIIQSIVNDKELNKEASDEKPTPIY